MRYFTPTTHRLLLAAAFLGAGVLPLPSAAAPARQSVTKPAGKPAGRPAARAAKTGATRPAPAPLSLEQKISHVLNRLGYGPRPGDRERVREMGVERWIAEQLQPEKIPDDDIAARLAPLVTLRYSPRQLMLAYQVDKSNFARKARLRQEEQLAQQGASPAELQKVRARNKGNDLTPELEAFLSERERALLAEAEKDGLKPNDAMRALGELQQERLIRAAHSNRQLQEVLVDFWSNHFNLDVKKGQVMVLKVVDEHEAIRPHVLGRFRDLLEASAKSPAMLVYLDNARSTVEKKISLREQQQMRARLQRRAARQAGNGQAGDNAANDENEGAMAMPAMAMPAIEVPTTRGGINENYGRELMELHTLGVDGGYTQQDVREVARCFTGWTVDYASGEFRFRPSAHDDGPKVVLGHAIAAGGGIRDGEQVLDILASHPATARHISRKLCMRFISDAPPASIVNKAAQTFLRTGGDLREVVRTIVTSPEFFSPAAYRAKIKSPLEYAVSAVRALDANVNPAGAAPGRTARRPRQRGDARNSDNRVRLIALADGASSARPGGGNRRFQTMGREIAAMGQPLFSYQAPTGYPEDSSEWVSTGALVARLNYALALTAGRIEGVDLPEADTPAEETPAATLDYLLARLLDNEVSNSTRQTLQEQARDAGAAQIAALVIGSPEFQRR